MPAQIKLGDLAVDVVLKDIKNIHLSVHPPAGRVTVAAPSRMSLSTIRVFAIAKLPWIRKQQKKILAQERETPREYLERESHYVWGKRYLLHIVEAQQSPAVELKGNRLVLRIRPATGAEQRQEIIEDWYRELLREAALPLIAKWEKVMDVRVKRLFVRRMKTKWGSCNHRAKTIRLNTDLAKKPHECLEYLVVHELVHLLEPSHNARFIALMEQYMPKWRSHRQALNRLPVRHERWAVC